MIAWAMSWSGPALPGWRRPASRRLNEALVTVDNDSMSTATSGARDPWQLLWASGGVALFALGAVGIVVPLLPTTVFWIGAVACFARSSPALAERILTHPRYGGPIRDFREHRVIGRSGKHAALATMALSALITALLTRSVIVSGLACAILSLVALYILTRPESVPATIDERAVNR